jgi:hypothetical protein
LQTGKYKIQAPGNKRMLNVSDNHESIKPLLTGVWKYGVPVTHYMIRNLTKCYYTNPFKS